IPVIAYNLPGVTGMNLDRAFYTELLERTDAVQYVKDTSGSMSQAYDLLFNLDKRMTPFIGWDTILLPAFAAGAAGTIWGAPNFAPRECVRLWDLSQAGKQEEANELFQQIWNIMNFTFEEGYSVSVKAAAEIVGIPLGDPRAPYGRLPEDKMAKLRKLIAEAGLQY
ncbi:MAG: dihydrodipicolinate synthase family protein, partial [Streptomyces sp.]|nr:dihydrodipicolinate synthase family protein [Streptomyces sp.]